MKNGKVPLSLKPCILLAKIICPAAAYSEVISGTQYRIFGYYPESAEKWA